MTFADGTRDDSTEFIIEVPPVQDADQLAGANVEVGLWSRGRRQNQVSFSDRLDVLVGHILRVDVARRIPEIREMALGGKGKLS